MLPRFLDRKDIPEAFVREITDHKVVRTGLVSVVKGILKETGDPIQTLPLTNIYMGVVPDRRFWFKTENGSFYFIRCPGRDIRSWLTELGFFE